MNQPLGPFKSPGINGINDGGKIKIGDSGADRALSQRRYAVDRIITPVHGAIRQRISFHRAALFPGRCGPIERADHVNGSVMIGHLIGIRNLFLAIYIRIISLGDDIGKQPIRIDQLSRPRLNGDRALVQIGHDSERIAFLAESARQQAVFPRHALDGASAGADHPFQGLAAGKSPFSPGIPIERAGNTRLAVLEFHQTKELTIGKSTVSDPFQGSGQFQHHKAAALKGGIIQAFQMGRQIDFLKIDAIRKGKTVNTLKRIGQDHFFQIIAIREGIGLNPSIAFSQLHPFQRLAAPESSFPDRSRPFRFHSGQNHFLQVDTASEHPIFQAIFKFSRHLHLFKAHTLGKHQICNNGIVHLEADFPKAGASKNIVSPKIHHAGQIEPFKGRTAAECVVLKHNGIGGEVRFLQHRAIKVADQLIGRRK